MSDIILILFINLVLSTTTHNRLFKLAKRQFLLYGSQLVNTPHLITCLRNGQVK